MASSRFEVPQASVSEQCSGRLTSRLPTEHGHPGSVHHVQADNTLQRSSMEQFAVGSPNEKRKTRFLYPDEYSPEPSQEEDPYVMEPRAPPIYAVSSIQGVGHGPGSPFQSSAYHRGHSPAYFTQEGRPLENGSPAPQYDNEFQNVRYFDTSPQSPHFDVRACLIPIEPPLPAYATENLHLNLPRPSLPLIAHPPMGSLLEDPPAAQTFAFGTRSFSPVARPAPLSFRVKQQGLLPTPDWSRTSSPDREHEWDSGGRAGYRDRPDDGTSRSPGPPLADESEYQPFLPRRFLLPTKRCRSNNSFSEDEAPDMWNNHGRSPARKRTRSRSYDRERSGSAPRYREETRNDYKGHGHRRREPSDRSSPSRFTNDRRVYGRASRDAYGVHPEQRDEDRGKLPRSPSANRSTYRSRPRTSPSSSGADVKEETGRKPYRRQKSRSRSSSSPQSSETSARRNYKTSPSREKYRGRISYAPVRRKSRDRNDASCRKTDNHSRGRSADRNHSGASHQRKIESSTLDSKDKAKARQVSRVADFSPESDYYVQGRTGDIKVLSAKKTVSKAMRADASSPVSSPGTGVRVDASSPVSCNGAEPSSSKGKATIITLQKDGKREVVSGSKTAEVSVATSEAYGQPQPPADDVSSKRSAATHASVVASSPGPVTMTSTTSKSLATAKASLAKSCNVPPNMVSSDQDPLVSTTTSSNNSPVPGTSLPTPLLVSSAKSADAKNDFVPANSVGAATPKVDQKAVAVANAVTRKKAPPSKPLSFPLKKSQLGLPPVVRPASGSKTEDESVALTSIYVSASNTGKKVKTPVSSPVTSSSNSPVRIPRKVCPVVKEISRSPFKLVDNSTKGTSTEITLPFAVIPQSPPAMCPAVPLLAAENVPENGQTLPQKPGRPATMADVSAMVAAFDEKLIVQGFPLQQAMEKMLFDCADVVECFSQLCTVVSRDHDHVLLRDGMTDLVGQQVDFGDLKSQPASTCNCSFVVPTAEARELCIMDPKDFPDLSPCSLIRCDADMMTAEGNTAKCPQAAMKEDFYYLDGWPVLLCKSHIAELVNHGTCPCGVFPFKSGLTQYFTCSKDHIYHAGCFSSCPHQGCP